MSRIALIERLPIAGMVEGKGEVRVKYVTNTKKEHLHPFIVDNVLIGAKVCTDEW